MASIDDRWWKEIKDKDGNVVDKVKTDRYGKGKRWLLRWRDPDKQPRKLSFAKWTDANNKRKEIEGDMLKGSYIDPKAGQITFDKFAAEWLANRTSDPLTIENTAGRLRRYVTGTTLGKTPLVKIRPSTVQAWIKGLTIADSTARVVFDHVASILAAAVEDELIPRNPALSKSVKPPKRERERVVPWSSAWVAGMRERIEERYRPLVVVGAGLGLRPGEAFGLSPDDIDWLRGWVHVRRQVKIVGNRRVFALPKGGKTRDVPLAPSVREELAAYLAKYPAREVTLPWAEPDGDDHTVSLILTNESGRALHSASVTAAVWYPALDAVGIPRDRKNGAHALRHYYASKLLDAGESIKAVAEYLGHADPSFTLRTYTHLMPSSEERTRKAIDAAFAELAAENPDLAKLGGELVCPESAPAPQLS